MILVWGNLKYEKRLTRNDFRFPKPEMFSLTPIAQWLFQFLSLPKWHFLEAWPAGRSEVGSNEIIRFGIILDNLNWGRQKLCMRTKFSSMQNKSNHCMTTRVNSLFIMQTLNSTFEYSIMLVTVFCNFVIQPQNIPSELLHSLRKTRDRSKMHCRSTIPLILSE